jgi:hypothetical protein
MELPAIRITDLLIGLLTVVNGAILLHHFRKHGERFAKYRIVCFSIMLSGFFVAFGEFFYDLAFLR